jgi:hypothetical protein
MSRAIRCVNWGPYSHASWLTAAQTEIEAWRKGVTAINIPFANHTPETRVDLFEFLDADGVDQAMQHFLRRQVGKRYDWVGILSFVTRRNAENQDRWFCSELIFSAALHARKNLLARIQPYKVTPAMIAYSPILRYVRSCIVPDYRKMRAPNSAASAPRRDPASSSACAGGVCGCPPEPEHLFP